MNLQKMAANSLLIHCQYLVEKYHIVEATLILRAYPSPFKSAAATE